MAITKSKRQQMEKMIYDTFSALDPSGDNTKKYRDMFSSMSDGQFDTFFKKFFANEDMYLILDIVDYERTLTIEQIEKAARVIDIPLFERVATPFVNMDKESPVLSKYAVPVGYLHVKRLQQMVRKKNTTSTDISSRSAITGQVVGKDKNARDSDQENYALVTMGAEQILRELMGPRADDMVMKNEMYAQISRNGYVSMDDLPNRVENKTALNTLDTFLIGMGIKSDLITDGLIVKKTIK